MIGLLIIFSTTVFAADFIITPKFGISRISAKSKNVGDKSYGDIKPSKAGWTSGVAGLGLGIVTDKRIMVLFNNDLHFGGTIKAKDFYNTEGDYNVANFKGGLYFWQSALILGYSFSPMDNLTCNFGVGLAFGLSHPMAKDFEFGASNATSTEKTGTQLSIECSQYTFPIHFDVQYFFTEKIGLTVELQDIIGSVEAGYGANATDKKKTGVFNNFSLKIGPAFKL